MTRRSAAAVARDLVTERFPGAVQAWLSGSTVLGGATATSDLDVTVLLEHTEVHRESLVYDEWPVELFVHTETSIYRFVAKDLARRRPTMARLVGQGIPLVPFGGGAEVRADCRGVLAAGPPALSDDQLALLRYGLTDLVDDLSGVAPGPEATAVSVEVWRQSAELALGAARHWSGGGKWLVRELVSLDVDLAGRLDAALRSALVGETGALVAQAQGVLDRCGGRLWDGFRLGADEGTDPRER
jgi:hypothetical protein